MNIFKYIKYQLDIMLYGKTIIPLLKIGISVKKKYRYTEICGIQFEYQNAFLDMPCKIKLETIDNIIECLQASKKRISEKHKSKKQNDE